MTHEQDNTLTKTGGELDIAYTDAEAPDFAPQMTDAADDDEGYADVADREICTGLIEVEIMLRAGTMDRRTAASRLRELAAVLDEVTP